MKTLVWRLVDDDDIGGNIIHFVERGNVSHVEFISPDGHLAIGARLKGGVLARDINYKKFSCDLRFHATCGDEQYASTMRFLNAQLGKPYDFREIIGIGLNRNWRETDSWICSELWAATMEAGNLIGQIASSINLITPQDCLLLSSAMFLRL